MIWVRKVNITKTKWEMQSISSVAWRDGGGGGGGSGRGIGGNGKAPIIQNKIVSKIENSYRKTERAVWFIIAMHFFLFRRSDNGVEST